MPSILLQLDEEMLRAFDLYCQQKNTTRTHALRVMIASATGLPKPKKPKYGVKSTSLKPDLNT